MNWLLIIVCCNLFDAVTTDTWNFAGLNIAKGKSTFQSPGTYKGFTSDLAVDGNTNTKFAFGSCSHTGGGQRNTKATWTVYLNNSYTIKGIRIFNRYTNRHRHKNFMIMGQPSSIVLHDDKTANPQLYNNQLIDIAVDTVYNFYSITVEVPAHTGNQDNGVSFLQLCEVQIYSENNDCRLPTPVNGLQVTLKPGTGYLDTTKRLVSTYTVLEFRCDDHYTMQGNREAACMQGGSYNTNIPTCAEIQCNRPLDIANGNYVPALSRYSVGDTITYTCEEGYISDQPLRRTCLITTYWSGETPVCNRTKCSFPGQFINGVLYNGFYMYTSGSINSGTFVNVVCAEGFQAIVQEIYCQLNGQWDVLPQCTQIECKQLEKVVGGYYTYSFNNRIETNSKTSYVYGTVATVACNETLFKSSNKTTRTCRQRGYWTGTDELCVALCEVPTFLIRHFLNKKSFYEAGQLLTPTCVSGFELDGQTPIQATCQKDHTWDITVPSCIALKCNLSDLRPELYFYEFAEMLNGYIEFNDTLLTNCKRGYELIDGYNERVCLANQTLTGTELKCTAIANEKAEKSPLIAAAAGGGTSALVIIFAAVAIVLFVVFRRRTKGKQFSDSTSIAETPPAAVVYSNEIYQENNVYENFNNDTVAHREPYYDFTDIHKIPQTGITLEQLADVVIAPSAAIDRFQTEFLAFPEGMVREHQHALQNMKNNRYKGLYAYDDTRVLLEIWNKEKDTDYINACYIHGFDETKAYIASQGPVDDIMDDFWRMMWQKNCGKIVMLTNLREDGKMKCKRYWPEMGTETFGSIHVTLENEEVFSNFIIRSLHVRKGEENRELLQFHFTAWPDKDVPHFCSALVHFRSKVKAAKASCTGPMLIHCSAGIGRTGTFIAIDYLVDQAMRLGYVDVSGCVETLRRQRVNMVQTKEQYIFVHLALVEILVMKSSTVPTAQFEETYQNMLLIDADQRKRKIDIEFELLWNILPVDDDIQASKAKEHLSKTKNRYSNIVPFKDFMPSLSQPGLYMFGEYINASFLPMYREANAMIITQSPLENTISDFWNMVLHQDVHTIIMVNHTDELSEKEKYWPAPGECSTYNDIRIMRTGNQHVEKHNGHKIVRLSITIESQQREVMLIQFEKWDKGNILPDNPNQILTALELMEVNQRNTGNKPIIVHCMDGVEKSGLFCVVAALLDRLKVEQDVAISQVIQEMRNRRQNMIPNVEQFQFCHEVVKAFLQQYETYSNFAFKM